jgi:hypothetical protein
MGIDLQEQANSFSDISCEIEGRDMAMNWKEVVEKIDKETEAIQYTPSEDVLKIFKYNIIESGAGSYDQAFTTMVFTEGDCRALAFYNANNLLVVAEEERFDLDHMKTLARLYIPLGSEFLGYCGLKNVWEFAKDVLAALDTLETKDDYRELLNSYNTYVSVIHGWIHHYFPWNIGELFPQKKKEDILRMAELSSELNN